MSACPVFADATPRGVANQRPQSHSELRGVSRVGGVGEKKLERYGEAVRGIVTG